jgi:hypothetical protein
MPLPGDRAVVDTPGLDVMDDRAYIREIGFTVNGIVSIAEWEHRFRVRQIGAY